MGKLLIVNGSPRAPKSNSKKYIAILKKFWKGQVEEYMVTAKDHKSVLSKIQEYDHLVFVFPLYVDSLPVPFMDFLKQLEQLHKERKPILHVLINCGFLESEQNEVAIKIMKLFCKKSHFSYGMTLCIGSGEAILTTPFAFMVKRKIRKFVYGIQHEKQKILKVTMPLSKKSFIKASTKYWEKYGRQNKITKEQMATMKIEE